VGVRDWLLRGEKWQEKRTITSAEVPWVPFNMGGSLNYGTVSPDTALSLSSVYAANRLIAQSVSTLPLKTYRRLGPDGRQPMPTLPQLFQQLQTDGTLVPWLHRCVASLTLRGNAYGLIVSRDGFGFPTLIEWLDPGRVTDDGRPGKTGWLYNGREVANEDIVHIPLFAVPGKRCGLSPLGSFARTLGVGLQAQAYAEGWFGAGGFPPGKFKNNQKTVTASEADAIKARLSAAIKSRDPLVYGADWDYDVVSVPPEEAQFVETIKMTTNQIAAIYGIPPEMIGGESGSSMTYANVEQQQINFVMFTLRPYLVVLETAFSALLPDRQYVKFNSDALIRADLKTRWEVNQIRTTMGAASIDEIREQEDQPLLPNGQGAKFAVPAATPPALPAAANQADNSSGNGDVPPIRRIQ
jgi:HK97 family phage portal protein